MFWLTRFLVLLTLSETSASKASSILANSETDYSYFVTDTLLFRGNGYKLRTYHWLLDIYEHTQI